MAKKPKNTAPVTDRQAKIDAAAKANKPGPNKILIGTIVALLAIIGVVAGVIIADQSNRGDSPAAAAGSLPPGLSEGEGYVANPDATLVDGAPTLDIYEDFRCPACHRAYAVFHDTVSTLADEGKVKLVYHFKTVIDSQDGNTHSRDAAAAAMCAADAGQFSEFHEAVLGGIVDGGGQQPQWGDAFFTSAAEQAGITGDALTTFDSCVADGTYEAYISGVDQASAAEGVNSTPQYHLNGELVDFQTVNTPELFVQAVENATGQ
ncbi:MAG: thioredoxin domain-containing protein [Intrasporangiaceae bacterium]|nr:thioredoxin domain-containing protein [Intrasporangiaceae bacterium]